MAVKCVVITCSIINPCSKTKFYCHCYLYGWLLKIVNAALEVIITRSLPDAFSQSGCLPFCAFYVDSKFCLFILFILSTYVIIVKTFIHRRLSEYRLIKTSTSSRYIHRYSLRRIIVKYSWGSVSVREDGGLLQKCSPIVGAEKIKKHLSILFIRLHIYNEND